MNLRLRRFQEQTDEKLFFLAYGLFLVFTVLATSFYYGLVHGLPFRIMYLICTALLVFREIRYLKEYPHRLLALGLLSVLFVISFWTADGALQRSIPCIFMFLFCARHIPFRRIAAFTLIVGMTLFTFIVLSARVGILYNHIAQQGDRTREYLGFRYALFPSAHMLNFTMLWTWLNRKRVPVPGAILFGIANWWLYTRTDSRLAFVLADGLLIVGLLMRYAPRFVEKVMDKLRGICAFSFAGAALLGILSAFLYNWRIPWMAFINDKISGRLNLGHQSLIHKGVTWFGQQIDWNGHSLDVDGKYSKAIYDYVDCLYVKVLQKYGIIFFCLVIALLTLAMIRACMKKQDLLLIFMTSIALHCILDDLSSYLYYNTFWFAAGYLLLNPRMLEDDPAHQGTVIPYGALWEKWKKRKKRKKPGPGRSG